MIEVADTGIGIPVDEQEHLFTRFFRSSTAQEQAIPGSGLGLSIAHSIAEMHGGDVAVESEPGVGTTFRVQLPGGLLSRRTCRNIQSSTTVGAGDPRRTPCPPSPSTT